MAIVGTILLLIPYVFVRLFPTGIFTVLLGNTFQACGFSILLVQSIDNPSFYFYRVLNLAWVQWIGVLSYSIYIWQMIFCTSPSLTVLDPCGGCHFLVG